MVHQTLRALVAGTIALLVWGGGTAPAHAQMVRELVPLASLGVTDNANASAGVRQRAEFGTAALTGRVRYQAARSNHALSNHLSLTHFFGGVGSDTISDTLSWISAFDLTAKLQFRTLANASISRGSGVDPGDVSAVTVPRGSRGTTSVYLATGVGEELVYRPSPLRLYSESVTFNQVRYLTRQTIPGPTPGTMITVPLRNNTLVSAGLRGEWGAARDTVILDIHASDSYITPDATMPDDFALGHTILGQALLGWRRELSAFWSSEIQAGPLFILKTNGDGVLAPSGMAALTYKGIPWFATLVLSHSPAPNLYVGEATVTSQALLRLAVPLNRRETFLLAGYGAYVYARIVTDASGDLTRGFDQVTGGATLLARSQSHPFWGALTATFIDQRGNSLPNRYIPDLLIRTVLLSVGAAFAFGPGTPAVFSGSL